MSAEHPTTTHDSESPRRLLQLLKERAQYQHQFFAWRLMDAGFVVRRVVRQRNHANVWGVFLRRGSVLPGHELETVKRTVSAVLGGLGMKCPRKEVAALTKGDRVEAFFSFVLGTPGTLNFYQGREQWMPETEEDTADWQD
jgi:hypothetical protein